MTVRLYYLPGYAAGRKTAGKASPLRNPFTRLDVQVILSICTKNDEKTC